MQRINWQFISTFEILQPNTLVKSVGVVLSVVKQQNFVSFVVSDMTGSVQATLYQNIKSYSWLQIPKIGNSVTLLGYTNKKQLRQQAHIIKLKLKMFSIITQLQELIIIEKILAEEKSRKQDRFKNLPIPKTKRPLIKQLQFMIQAVDMRTLVLGCVYITLENNLDLENYIFNVDTIKKHRLTKSFLEVKEIKEEAVNYLDSFIRQAIQYLITQHFIEEKQPVNNIQMFKIYRKTLSDIEMRIMGLINSKKNDGIGSGELVWQINKEYGYINQKNFIFNQNFVQRILKKLIDEGKIYKSADKKLYPNN